MRIAYFGGDGMVLCLAALVAGDHRVERVFVPAWGAPRVRGRARRLGARVHAGKPSRDQVAALGGEGIDLIVSAGFPHLIPVRAGDAVRGINIHPSLLPMGRGLFPYPHVILLGHRESGVTVHELDEHFDTGAILYQDRLAVSPRETVRSLRARSRLLAARALQAVMDDFEALWQARQPQERGEYWKPVPASDRVVDWGTPVDEIERHVRALEMTATIAGARRRLVTAVPFPGYDGNTPGQVIARDHLGGFLVAAGDGAVWVTTMAGGNGRGVLRRRLRALVRRLRLGRARH